MDHLFLPELRQRLHAVRIFMVTAVLATIVGGVAAAAGAHDPTRGLMWAVAFLVLVVGVAQAVLGLGQALLPANVPGPSWRVGEWLLFNLGSAGVIVGTLLATPWLVTLGTVLFVAALIAFLFGVRGGRAGWLLHAFRAVLVITCLGACVGLVLSLARVAL